MMIFKKALPRRSFLKGAGATMALPFLDAMVPAHLQRPVLTVNVHSGLVTCICQLAGSWKIGRRQKQAVIMN